MNNQRENVKEILGKRNTKQSFYELQDVAVHVSGIKRAVTEIAIEYIINHLNSDYQFIETIEKAAKNCNVTQSAMVRALKSMCECEPPFMERKAQSVYQISAEYLVAISEYNLTEKLKRSRGKKNAE